MSVLAFDLGASSGRAILGRLTDRQMEIEEIHRFPNDPVHAGGRLYWDILRLYHEIKQGLLKVKHQGITLNSMAIDSWAVDFGFIAKNGELLGNPYHYRDSHTAGIMSELFKKIPEAELFSRTGIQLLPFNTIFQLYALHKANSPLLAAADRLLMIPELLRYYLTGEMAGEFTNATTTQLFHPTLKRWDDTIISKLGFSPGWFGSVVQPGTAVGQLHSRLQHELGIAGIPVVAAGEHDTASAVAAVPASKRPFAYLSCGTWSLMGTEVEQPVIHELARKLKFSNEGGVCGTFRLLKNIMGLWILQECRRQWMQEGRAYSFPELLQMAEQAPAFAAYIDPDDERFLPQGNMPERIREYCLQTGQSPPQEPEGIVRCILESLALKYRYVLNQTEQLSGQAFDGLHMVGGGIQNQLLCQWTANAIGRPVWAGPAEGSAIGNLAVQWISQGELADIWEARKVIGDSFPVIIYEPGSLEMWRHAYGSFLQKTGLKES
ncbi:rhamnulokinase [Paenibacillus senegalensis]|uniref:rhamnulokinase n=1 Tax=Paenibacillus senegalensis TaxID=1465766 RepID=UPI000289DC33|nr:rhamnulokinase family protein [Paenibacillus senegalensis]